MPAMRKRATLTQQIRAAALGCGMSNNALARAVGIDKGAMSRYLSGKMNLTGPHLDALADLLGLRIMADGPKRMVGQPDRRNKGNKR